MNIIKIILSIILGFIIAGIISEYTDLRNDDLWIFRNNILNKYNNKKIAAFLSKKMPDDYSGDLKHDLDIFIIKNVFKELNEYESKKLRRYNAFISADEMNDYNEESLKNANEIYGEVIKDSIYYINLEKFYVNATYENFKKYITELKKYHNLILDLRDNSGGYFKSFRKISDLFLAEQNLIYRRKNKSGEIIEEYFSKNEQQIKFDNIVILVNEKTASVSELLILALKHNLKNVLIIGTPTRGKYFSYSIRIFKDGTGYRFITSLMEGPEGSQIPEYGIKPDIIIKDRNKQLDKAVDYLLHD